MTTTHSFSLGALTSLHITHDEDEGSITLAYEDLVARLRRNRMTRLIYRFFPGMEPKPFSIKLTREQAELLGGVLMDPKAGGAHLLMKQLGDSVREG